MADHMQDEADLEALRRWWDENGKGIVAAVVVAVLGTCLLYTSPSPRD